jgi:hypothetical protein
MLLSGHHFIRYARCVVGELEVELDKCRIEKETPEFHEGTAAC